METIKYRTKSICSMFSSNNSHKQIFFLFIAFFGGEKYFSRRRKRERNKRKRKRKSNPSCFAYNTIQTCIAPRKENKRVFSAIFSRAHFHEMTGKEKKEKEKRGKYGLPSFFVFFKKVLCAEMGSGSEFEFPPRGLIFHFPYCPSQLCLYWEIGPAPAGVCFPSFLFKDPFSVSFFSQLPVSLISSDNIYEPWGREKSGKGHFAVAQDLITGTEKRMQFWIFFNGKVLVGKQGHLKKNLASDASRPGILA